MFIKCNGDIWVNTDHVKRIEEEKDIDGKTYGYKLYGTDNYIFDAEQIGVVEKFLKEQ